MRTDEEDLFASWHNCADHRMLDRGNLLLKFFAKKIPGNLVSRVGHAVFSNQPFEVSLFGLGRVGIICPLTERKTSATSSRRPQARLGHKPDTMNFSNSSKIRPPPKSVWWLFMVLRHGLNSSRFGRASQLENQTHRRSAVTHRICNGFSTFRYRPRWPVTGRM